LISVSLDKVVLLSNTTPIELKSLLCGTPIVKRYYPIRNIYKYQHNYELFDGSHVQLGYGGIRLGFNPNNCLPCIIADFIPKLIKPSVSRIDIAIDYTHDLSRFFWFDKTGRRHIRALYSDPNDKERLTGVYFGGRKSRLTFVVYDKIEELRNKARELNDKVLVDKELEKLTGKTLWRVEARLKSPSRKNILPIDLFAILCAGGIDLFPKDDTHLRRLPRFPGHIKKLNGYRRKLARRLSMGSEDRLSVQPQEAYELFRADMIASLSRYILIPPTSENQSLLDTYDEDNDRILFTYFMPDN
jgi:hypothetical protein